MTLLAKTAPHLPYLRRYAHALMNSPSAGDAMVRETLEALASGATQLDSSMTPRVGLYHAFHEIWRGFENQPQDQKTGRQAKDVASPQWHLPLSQHAFLLTAMEGFALRETADILNVEYSEVEDCIIAAQGDIDGALRNRILIIEDEPLIACELTALVEEMQHEVIGIATTQQEAVDMAARENPGLILADIQLADGSNGINAVIDILRMHEGVPVIFMTGYPDRLLTRENRPNSTFLITKPYQPETVKAAIGQVLYFPPRREPAPSTGAGLVKGSFNARPR